MNIQPKLEPFKSTAKKGLRIPVYCDLTADCETPITAYSKIAQERPAFLFESVVGAKISVAIPF